MKQYTNAYRRIPVYAYQFMAGPAALEAPVAARGRGGACVWIEDSRGQARGRGRIAVWRGAFEGDVVQR